MAALDCRDLLDLERTIPASRSAAAAQPNLDVIAAVGCALLALGVPQAVYFESVSVLHYLLGTAVVAVSVPLYRNLHKLARELRSMAMAVAGRVVH